jgi:hypothetical protein
VAVEAAAVIDLCGREFVGVKARRDEGRVDGNENEA